MFSVLSLEDNFIHKLDLSIALDSIPLFTINLEDREMFVYLSRTRILGMVKI